MKTFFKFLRGFLMVWGILFILAAGVVAFSVYNLTQVQAPPLPDQMFLTATIEQDIPEVFAAPGLTTPFLSRTARFHDLIQTLKMAEGDPKVTGLAVRIRPNSLSVAQIQELRQAIARFRAAGKQTYAFANALSMAYRATNRFCV